METDIPISSANGPGTREDTRMRSSDPGGLHEELSRLKSDLDTLMLHASTLSEKELRAARDQLMARFSSMRHAARDFAERAGKQFSQSWDVTADHVRQKPLQSIVLAAGIGMLIGVLLRRD